MVREAIVAGQFYADEFSALDKQINECFEGAKGPGTTPLKRNPKRRVRAVIVPHAGYLYSGECAAWAYKEIAESEMPDVYIIIGPSHSGMPTCISKDDWKTPLGIVKTDKGFCDEFEKVSGILSNTQAHMTEHSIEVQLPFLQFASKDNLQSLKIMPLMVSKDIAFEDIAESIRKTEKLTKKKAVIIISSDFTHFGRNYHYVPFSQNVDQQIYDQDNTAADLIIKKDIKGFIEFLNKTHATICGYYGILILMSLIKQEDCKGELLNYYTSADISGDHKNMVGYAAVVFK